MGNTQEQNIKDILEIVTFIKDKAATKDDLNLLESRMDGKITEM